MNSKKTCQNTFFAHDSTRVLLLLAPRSLLRCMAGRGGRCWFPGCVAEGCTGFGKNGTTVEREAWYICLYVMSEALSTAFPSRVLILGEDEPVPEGADEYEYKLTFPRRASTSATCEKHQQPFVLKPEELPTVCRPVQTRPTL